MILYDVISQLFFKAVTFRKIGLEEGGEGKDIALCSATGGSVALEGH